MGLKNVWNWIEIVFELSLKGSELFSGVWYGFYMFPEDFANGFNGFLRLWMAPAPGAGQRQARALGARRPGSSPGHSMEPRL